jgi:uncharacterized membrane protein
MSMRLPVAYLAALAALVVLDGLWLGLVAKDFYRQQLGSLMRPDVRFGVAAAFYLVYLVGVVIFAVQPALQEGSAVRALVLGALFGFFCYATYDLTNLATLRDWPAKLSVVDLAWGTFLSAIAALAGYLAASRISA